MLWVMRLGTDFSGIGAPEMALKYLGIDFESVFACEIDKHARKSFQQLHNPKTFYNDITKRNHKEVEKLDFYVAGFPCQAFSMAGKRKGFDEARGTLFFNVAEFIKINQPKVFILENVKGLLSHDKGRTFQTIVDILSNGGGTQNGQIGLDVFDDGLGYHIYWQVLNTKNYGIPQNRERIFIVGFKDFRDFRFPKEIPLELKLKDILQDKVDDKYYLSDKMIASFTNHKERHKEKGTGFQWKPKNVDSIANCLRANAALCPSDNTIEWVADYRNDEGLRIRKEGISPCLAATKNSETELSRMTTLIKQKRIRRLTPLETWRLQGFKDEDFYKVKDVSDTQLYKQAGNSITVDVLMHLFTKIYA
jgi:DNA (cytosine-5)-methyltransferase 1